MAAGPGGDAKLGANLPLGEKAALRVAGYYNRIAGFMDAVQPDLTRGRGRQRRIPQRLPGGREVRSQRALAITPRLVYQRVKMDGWNRIDDFNILANPFTTTRPAVTLGEREQFTQLEEEFTDDFVLADVMTSTTSLATWR